MMAGMTRDWDHTWQHWHELSAEERAAVGREMAALVSAAHEAFVLAMKQTAEAMRELARSLEKSPR